MTRLLTAAFLIPVAWYLCKRAPFPAFLVAASILSAIATWEAAMILRHRGSKPFIYLAVAGSLAIAGVFALPGERSLVVAALAAIAVATPAAAMLRRDTPEAMLDTSMTTFFPVLFVGLPFAFVVGLQATPGTDGPDLLLLAMCCVILSDAAAYYVGSMFGKHPLAPVISPKKTWEGVGGGVLGSILGALVAHVWFFQRLPLVHAISLGVVLSLAGVVGDLAESMLKRAAGVKDSSALLPGHGGALDRVDSLLVAAPVLYYYWSFLIAGTR